MLGFILVTGIGFGIAWWIASTGLAYWRSIAGFITGFIFSWIGGGIVIGAVLVGADGFLPFFDRSLLYAVFGAGWGVYQARARLKRGLKSAAAATVSPTQGRQPPRPVNDAFAEALSEIEESRLDKGVWARAFADAGGGAEKAKALYIRARAEALKNDEVWQVTQPSVDESNLGTSGGGSNWDIYNVIQMLLPILKVGVIVIFVVVVGGFVSKDFRNTMYSIKSYFIQSFIKNSSHDVGSDEGWRSSVAELRRDIDAGKLSTRRMEVEIIKEPLDVLNYSQRAFMSKGDVNLIEENNLWWVEQNKIFIKIINHTGNIINGVVFDLAQSKCGTLMQQNELHLIFKFDASMLQPYSSVVYASELPFDYKQYFGTGVNCGVVSHVFTYR